MCKCVAIYSTVCIKKTLYPLKFKLPASYCINWTALTVSIRKNKRSCTHWNLIITSYNSICTRPCVFADHLFEAFRAAKLTQ